MKPVLMWGFRNRSPLWLYFALLMSGGLFLFFWLLSLMNDVNGLREKNIFNLKLYGSFFTLIFLLNITGIYYLITQFTGIQQGDDVYMSKGVVVFTSTIIFVTILVLNVLIYKNILFVEKKQISIIDIVLIVVMLLLLYFSFPFLQKKINSNLAENSNRATEQGVREQ